MPQVNEAVVKTADGVRGTIKATSWPLEGSQSEVLVQLDDGRQGLVPFSTLSQQADGSYVLSLKADELERRRAAGVAKGQPLVIPVLAEELDVQKRAVETGRVRIAKVIREREELVDEPLFREEAIIERVPINRFVEGPVPVRSEGNTVIVSLLEEVPVVEKRLMLKEELRITIRQVEAHKPVAVTLRSEEAAVERTESKDIPSTTPGLEEKKNA